MSDPATFFAPVIVRELAIDRTKSPHFNLTNMQNIYTETKWSNIGVLLSGNTGIVSMNNMKYTITNNAVDKKRSKMNVFISNQPNTFLFINNNVKDDNGIVTIAAKPLQLTIKNNTSSVIIDNLIPNTSYILYVDANMDIYCTIITL